MVTELVTSGLRLGRWEAMVKQDVNHVPKQGAIDACDWQCHAGAVLTPQVAASVRWLGAGALKHSNPAFETSRGPRGSSPLFQGSELGLQMAYLDSAR
ncbi:hypothetical protein D3C72_2300760 [compost metagenome]